jgi:hypothetical protein
MSLRRARKVNKKTRIALARAFKEIKKNTPKVIRKFKKAGIRPDPALVFVIAQHYRALNKLAKD